jgi:hypothetical protein
MKVHFRFLKIASGEQAASFVVPCSDGSIRNMVDRLKDLQVHQNLQKHVVL